MELEDLKIISELIHKYGIKAFEKVAETHSLFLDYMQNNVSDNNLIFHNSNDSNTYSKFYENETSQIFTNCKNSIYCFEPKIINFELLKTNTNIHPWIQMSILLISYFAVFCIVRLFKKDDRYVI